MLLDFRKMKIFHDLNIGSKFNESEGKSDLLEADKSDEPVNEQCDISENQENVLSTNEEIDEYKCDIIENIKICDTAQDGMFSAEYDPSEFQTKQEVDSDEIDQCKEDTQDSKCLVNEVMDTDREAWNKEDDFSQNRISEFFQHFGSMNTVKNEPPDFGVQSDCDERKDKETDASEDGMEDSKVLIQQYLDEEIKLWNSTDTVSSERFGTTNCSQHTTLVASEPLRIGTQSGCDEIRNEVTNVSEDGDEDSKSCVHQYLDEEGKFCHNIDVISLKKEGAARERHEIALLEKEDLKTNTCRCYLDEYSRSRSNLDSNVFDVHQKIHKCDMCECVTGSNLTLHIDTQHTKVNKNKCQLFDNSSMNSGNVKRQIDSVHRVEKKHKCHLCEYGTAKSSDLKCHIDSVHLKLKERKCQLCEYSTAKSGNMKRHIDSVHLKVKKEKKHKCHLCEYSTAKSYNLTCHIDRIHLELKGEKKRICPWCDYSCANSGDLSRHIDGVHLKVKKHKCHLCEYSFTSSTNRRRHINNVHLKVKKHNCHFCDYSSANSADLKRHIDSVHLNVKKHKCHLCDYSTDKSGNLTSHIDSVHLKVKREKEHKCHLCKYSSINRRDLKRHIDGVHLKVKKH